MKPHRFCLSSITAEQEAGDREPETGNFRAKPIATTGDRRCQRAAQSNGRTLHPFDPVSRQDRTLFELLMSGETVLHGFTNRELREKLARVSFPLSPDPAKRPAQVTRLLHRLHVRYLIAKIPRSRRWRVSLNGRRVMAAAVKLREVAYPSMYAAAA